jgi:elongator complex protein 1
MTELLADCKSQLNAQIPRIRELRTKKAEDPLAFLDGDVNDGADIPDNVSLAPTDASTAGGGSLFTRYTNRTGTVGTNATRRTSKNRRREERKKARGKKGSIYEEEYLVNSVGRLVDRVNSVNEEVDRLVVGLMRRGMRERAGAVQNAMLEVVDLCQGCLEEVFGPAIKEPVVELKDEDEPGRPKGGDGIMWDTLEGEKRREVPVVKGFARLTLLSR